MTQSDSDKLEPFVSVTCEGERCWCGQPAVKKVGEEIPFDDPTLLRHNLTSYVCSTHYAQLMGPAGAAQVGVTPTPATKAAPLVTEGMVLVPLEPSEAMLEAAAATPGMKACNDAMILHQARGYDFSAGSFADGSPLQQAWRAMVDAALKEQGQ